MGGRTPPITNRSGFLVTAAPPPSEMGASPHTPVYSCSKKARNDAWEALKELALVVVAFAIGGYIANWAIFKWYEIPTKVDAVNNALWQLLNR